MDNDCIVILSSDDWGWKTSKYQLAIRFARQNRVLFVSSIGFRSPTASRADLGRIWRKLLGFFRGARRVSENIWVVSPIVIPFGRGAFWRAVNRSIFRLQYAIALRFLRFDEPYLFVFSPNWRPYVESARRRKLVYYCVDEQSGFKGVDSRRFSEWDEDLTVKADHVVCSAERLYRKKSRLNRNTHYVPHGVNWHHFSRAMTDSELAPDPAMERISGVILLFFGHISYDWVDTELLRFIATSRPGWHIVLAGRNAVEPGEFSQCSNIVLLGERDYDDLPSLCKSATAGIIPFVDSELTAACNPLKLYEYLAAGLPVVSTDIPEVRRHSDIVHIANSHETFLAACDEAVRGDRGDYSRQSSELVREHDWDRRVEQIYALVT